MSQSSQFSLLGQRRFAPFFWTQFLGALNDNVFKTALLTILTYDALSWTDIDTGLLNILIPGLFILPFFLFSATAGQLADKMEKGRLARYVKLLEIAIMGIAAYGWMTHHLWLLVVAESTVCCTVFTVTSRILTTAQMYKELKQIAATEIDLTNVRFEAINADALAAYSFWGGESGEMSSL